jgi:uncharacterized membrane protein YbjE (DUF340 family)
MNASIIISVLILSIAAIVALRQLNRSKERRAMIEKGLDPSLVNIYSNNNSRRIFLYIGILLLGGAIGMITGILLAGLFKMPGETKEFILMSMIIFLGISCFVCYALSRNKSI